MRNKKLFLFFITLFAITTSFADTAEQALMKLLNDFRTMQADFSQAVTDSHGSVSQQSRGMMAISRPGKFHWEVTSPSKQLLVADGQYIWIYDADLAQATRQPLNNSKTSNPASLLSDTTESLQDRFIVKALPESDGLTAFELKPKAEEGMFQWIRLYFNKNELREMRMADNLGQQSIFQFTNVQLNKNLDPKLFQFTPKRGVDVIKQ